ncbi:polysaccharide pyruvyl transferase family protein [Notoacmeibacter ruber]|uniref:Polysaccharide pyruvyl transferase domain-containing protein n=1 Tax=Notoacmeibacter ruber TaxID=2670375 RepID=A0A3L7JET4_9HYPH|nr:polysaccharide pyruvyl transferase family protein [Notoacmeibacter ruber]RLQ88964.1 hypothetical protein D8780_12705 [Notoacmeibacter ruber]
MKLIHWISKRGNFGDDLNPWLWDRILPGWRTISPETIFFGVGTLLHERRMSGFRVQKTLILGSGVGYGDVPTIPPNLNWDIRALRGPVSASLLGLDESLGMIDPAYLIGDFDEYRLQRSRQRNVCFVPHYSTIQDYGLEDQFAASDIRLVSPSDDFLNVIENIYSASLVVTESLHGAIVADCFSIPWIPVQIHERFNASKWNDFTSYCEEKNIIKFETFIRHLPRRLGPVSTRKFRHRAIVGHERRLIRPFIEECAKLDGRLAERKVIDEKKRRFEETVRKVKLDYRIN